MAAMDYKERAKTVLSFFLTDFTAAEIERCEEGAYTGTFENDDVRCKAVLGVQFKIVLITPRRRENGSAKRSGGPLAHPGFPEPE